MPSSKTQSLQQLKVILLGVVADDVLTDEEVFYLKNWLDDNLDLLGQFPYDRVYKVINNALEDGILEQCELDEMLALFREWLDPTESEDLIKNIELNEKSIVITGDFSYGLKSDVEKFLVNRGAIVKSCVSKKVDYVIVGNLGSPDWSYGNYGAKVKRAKELQEEGINIKIVTEDAFFDMCM